MSREIIFFMYFHAFKKNVSIKVNFSPQSKRLAIFKELTGYSTLEFGKQCNIPSSATMQLIIRQGKVPSIKVLNKIIKRFPQLNSEWVMLGHGEMIVKGVKTSFLTDNFNNIPDESVFEKTLRQLHEQSLEIDKLKDDVQLLKRILN